MRKGLVKSWALAASLIAAPALAQKMPDIGFESVGRGRPLAASVLDYETRGRAELDPPAPPAARPGREEAVPA